MNASTRSSETRWLLVTVQLRCRLETLPAFDDEELQTTGNPVACFSVYLGTKGSNVEFEVSSRVSRE